MNPEMVSNQLLIIKFLYINTISAERVRINIKIIGINVNRDFTPILINHALIASNARAPNIWLADPNNGHKSAQVPENANAAAPATITSVATC